MAAVQPSTLQGNSGSRGTATPETNKSDEHIVQDIPSKTSDVEKVAAPTGPPPGMRPEDFPEGGKEAWLCVLGAWCGLFCTFGLNNCTGAFLDYYVQGPLASYGPSTVSWIVSTQTFFLSGTTALWGFLYDCYGPRWLLVGGSATYVFGLMMTSLCTQYWHFFLAQSIVAASGSGAVFNTCVVVIPSWFCRKRATAFGIMTSGASLGGVVLPIAFNRLTARLGFPWALRIIAFLFLALCATTCLAVTSRLPPRPRPFVWAAYAGPLREPALALVAAGNFFFVLGMFLPFNYLTLRAEATGVAPGLAEYLLPILNAASTAGRILPGLLADRVGPFNTVTLIELLSGVLTLGLWIPGASAGAAVAFGALFGFASGAFISLVPACIAQISDVGEIGTRTGAALCFQGLGALLGSPIGGAILTAMGGRYLGLQLFGGLVMLLGAVSFFLARVAQVGPRPLVKC